MPTAMVPLIDGFEEIEAITIIDILRRAGVEVTVAGMESRRVTGSHDVVVEADVLFDSIKGRPFDAIVLPGGPGTRDLDQIDALHQMLKRHYKAKKIIAAICAAPAVLATAGILDGRTACCFPSVEERLGTAHIVERPVVRDEHVITSRGAGTAIVFALAVVDALCGDYKAREVAESIVYSEYALPSR